MSETVTPTRATASTGCVAGAAATLSSAARTTTSWLNLRGDIARFLHQLGRLVSRPEPREDAVADAQRVGHDRQRGVHGRAGREEAGVDDVEVVHLVRAAALVERARRRVVAEADRAV